MWSPADLVGLGLHLRGPKFITALKYQLGEDIYRTAGPCPACGAHSDTLGDHTLCCGSAGERVSRHNALRDAIYSTNVAASLGPSREGRFLLPDDARRPVDILMPRWTGMTEPEPRFGETFGFALFCQGSVSFARFLPVFARFLPSFARFRPFFAPLLPENACFLPVFAPFRPVSPISPGSFGFVQIHQDSFGFVRPLFAWFRPSLAWTRPGTSL